MGFLTKFKSKSIYDEDSSQRANSETLPRKPAFDAGDEERGTDERDTFLIKAAGASMPGRLPPPPPTAPAAGPKSTYRSASVVVAPTHTAAPAKDKQQQHQQQQGRGASGGGQGAGAAAAQPGAPKPLLPEYKTAAQFHHKVELYKGSISTVFKALCTLTRTEVIIKQYIKQKMSSRSRHKMHREVRLMHMLGGQEGVARILGDFEDESYYYIIMEHCAGGDLYHRMILCGEFDEHWACKKVIIPLLRVLHYIHTESHIVHRDIKPENLFLTKADELRLGDFGLAIKQDEELPFLRAGTLDYMAPEVLANRVVEDCTEGPAVTAADLQSVGLRAYDEKVDVWAVGVLAFELLMGEAPFYHEDEKETERLIKESNCIPFPARMRMSHWADFVKTALKKDPRQRPSAGTLLSHPWVLQHSSSPLLFTGLKQPVVGGGALGRAASLPSAQLAALAGHFGSKAQQAKHGSTAAAAAAQPGGMQQSVQIRVDDTGGGFVNAPAPAVIAAGAAGAPAVATSHCSKSGEAATADGGAGGSPRSARVSRCCECVGLVMDDLRVDKRASLLELRATRSTGEAEETAHPHAHSHHPHAPAGPCLTHHRLSSCVPELAAAPARAGSRAGSREKQPPAGDAVAEAAGDSELHVRAQPAAAESQAASLEGGQGLRVSQGSEASPASPPAGPWNGRFSARRSEVAGDALDAFAAGLPSPTSPSPSTSLPSSPSHSPAPTSARPATPAGAAAAADPAHPPSVPAFLSTEPLPPVVPELASIQARPKSHSLPKSPFGARSFSIFAGFGASSQPPSPAAGGPAAAAPTSEAGGEAGGSEGALQGHGSTAAGSKVLAGWGKKPSRLSVAHGSAPGSPAAPAEGAAPASAPRMPQRGSAASRSGWSLGGGSGAGTQDDLRQAKSGSINRLKLYLSRQRGGAAS